MKTDVNTFSNYWNGLTKKEREAANIICVAQMRWLEPKQRMSIKKVYEMVKRKIQIKDYEYELIKKIHWANVLNELEILKTQKQPLTEV